MGTSRMEYVKETEECKKNGMSMERSKANTEKIKSYRHIYSSGLLSPMGLNAPKQWKNYLTNQHLYCDEQAYLCEFFNKINKE